MLVTYFNVGNNCFPFTFSFWISFQLPVGSKDIFPNHKLEIASINPDKVLNFVCRISLSYQQHLNASDSPSHFAPMSINIYKDFMNRTCQWVSLVDATHILQCAWAQDCIGYHWLSVNENLCLIDASRRSLDGVRWGKIYRVLFAIPPLPAIFHLLSTHLTNPCLKMGQRLEIEEFGWKYWQLTGNLQGPNRYWLLSPLARMLIMCPAFTIPPFPATSFIINPPQSHCQLLRYWDESSPVVSEAHARIIHNVTVPPGPRADLENVVK